MERTMSVEDKIRRAEEIYYKRREQEVPTRENIKRPGKEKINIKLFKKMIKQIVICLLIYSIFYLVVNSNYIFSEDFTNKAKEILSQDINFSQIYFFISDKVREIYEQIRPDEETVQNDIPKEEIQNNNENIGGAEELLTTEEQNMENIETTEMIGEENSENDNLVAEVNQDEGESTLSQMEQDANYIKSTISFIKPVNGTISSMFGLRNPTTATVPKNHTGTDIAAETGTKIISATDGKVILDSSTGDYGKHLKIQINDVIIVYAHCNKLYVKEGDTIKQGQEIAEVGSTGNATGPHLHFEIRYQDRYVDPQLVVEL